MLITINSLAWSQKEAKFSSIDYFSDVEKMEKKIENKKITENV
jgi:hypothetical protein